VSAALSEIAPAKINLTLRVVGRRSDGYHALESLVAFADLADRLSLEPAERLSLDVTGPFAGDCGPTDDNLILKTARAAALPAGRFKLDKRIPVAAGLGGGSADAAAALRLIARRNGLALSDARIVATARAIGADVPVCLDPQSRIMRGVGEELSAPIALPRLDALLVNPGVAVSTREVFAAFTLPDRPGAALDEVPLSSGELARFLAKHGNDLTRAAIGRAPVIAAVLEALADSPGCRVARMSGSGATCFGVFGSAAEAAKTVQRLASAKENWWICPVTLG
jgi:4-diphosphocytidyl-2-C-methyl-D-erythritol kinase